MTTTTNDAPERIWVWTEGSREYHETRTAESDVEYVRADLRSTAAVGEGDIAVFTDEELEYLYLHCDNDADRQMMLQIEKKVRRQIAKYREFDGRPATPTPTPDAQGLEVDYREYQRLRQDEQHFADQQKMVRQAIEQQWPKLQQALMDAILLVVPQKFPPALKPSPTAQAVARESRSYELIHTVHPECVADWFLTISRRWFEDKENMFYGQADAAKDYLWTWIRTGEFADDRTTLEIYVKMKFSEWLESSWRESSLESGTALTTHAASVGERDDKPVCPKCQQGFVCEHCGEPICDYYAPPLAAAGSDTK